MKLRFFAKAALLAASVAGALMPSTAVVAQTNEQFIPVLVYRTGAYAPNGIPWANGYVDYLKLVNAQGGINGVKLSWEECETGYATDRGVECYERLKGQKGGATFFQPLSTGIMIALTDKAFSDKIPIVTPGYGRSESTDGAVFRWSFPLLGTYWVAADALVQHIAKKEGGFDKLKGKKIALVYHDSPFGKDPIPVLTERSKMHGFDLSLIPVTAPGVEQRSAWLQVRQQRPDYVFLWGWGVMNSAAIKEAVATGYPREKMYGVWWAGAEPDVKDVGEGAKGYNALALQHSAGRAKMHAEILKRLHDAGNGSGPKEEVGSVLYNRGLISAMLGIEGVRRAQERFGKGKLMSAEQVRWGLENLALDQKRLDAIGLNDMMKPLTTTCFDHTGQAWSRVHSWTGSAWQFTSDWYLADEQLLKPMVKAAADRYAGEKKVQRRSPADCQS
jgi:branched-chain amino acid transport system substrate-binding protein